MTDRPIIFSAPMVRALLDGRKTQTRRVLSTPVPPADADQVRAWFAPPHVPVAGIPNQWAQSGLWAVKHGSGGYNRYCGPLPYRPGDRLYVREEYFQRGHWQALDGRMTKGGKQKWAFVPADDVIAFEAPAEFRKGRHHADPQTVAWHKRLGRFMPRWASRLTLIVEDVRVERLQAISEADAIAEGVEHHAGSDGPVAEYEALWNSLHGPDSWDANPFVVAVTFRVVRGNIDRIAA